MTALLSASSLHLRRGGREILHGIDLDVHLGEVVVVIGPNGAGKSSLLAALAGLLDISSGSIERHGRLVTVLQTPALARRSAIANVELALKWSPERLGRAERRARALRALKAMQADELADRPAATLSGGETRRVHLARGLVSQPEVLLLDEPFAGLDPSTRADLLYDAASALRSEDRATLLVVHDRAEAWALADRVIVLIEGTVQAQGSPSAVFDRPPTEVVAAFVGYTGRLERDNDVIRLRPTDVELSDDSTERGTVTKLVPVEDGIRVELATTRGTIVAISPPPGPTPHREVGFKVVGGIRYPKACQDSVDTGESHLAHPVKSAGL